MIRIDPLRRDPLLRGFLPPEEYPLIRGQVPGGNIPLKNPFTALCLCCILKGLQTFFTARCCALDPQSIMKAHFGRVVYSYSKIP